jgi:hypothetical protein
MRTNLFLNKNGAHLGQAYTPQINARARVKSYL